MIKKLFFISLFCLFACNKVQAQEMPVAEFFCGAELNYADVNFTRLYNVLINLTPGAKINLGRDWQIGLQAQVPIVNEGYAEKDSWLRLSMANVSKELHFESARQHFKITGGLFGKSRYGGDLRWMFPINSWLLFNAQVGVTNSWVVSTDLSECGETYFDTEKWSLTSILGGRIWLDKWATELRVNGGRYLNEDYGVEGEVMRHFKHCSVSLFAQYHEKAPSEYYKGTHRYGGGFRVVMMLPPYKKQKKAVVVRPASNFRLTYNAQSDGFSMKKYTTDPEENERTYPIHIPWGTGNFNE
jgi:hypothetical protein